MASSIPPPPSAPSSSKPYSQNRGSNYQTHRLQHHRNLQQNDRQTLVRPWPSSSSSSSHHNLTLSRPQSRNGPPLSISNPRTTTFTSPNSLSYHSQSELLSPDFSGQRSTRFVSKMHFGRPKATPLATRHTSTAEDALRQLLAIRFDDDTSHIDRVLVDFQPKLRGNTDDYTFLLRELGNKGKYSMAMRCFQFAIRRQTRDKEQGKLATAMISVLGRLGKVDLARYVFDFAVKDRYGNTIYIYSTLISAYAKSGCCVEAIKVFDSMKVFVLNPNLVTYNALIDVDRGHRDAMVAVNLKSPLWWSRRSNFWKPIFFIFLEFFFSFGNP